MAGDINRVIITGRLTKDPELGAAGDNSVCRLRIATNGRRRNPDTGQWEDAPNFFDVTVWGQQAENCQRFLSKGRQIGIDGRLRFREWTGQNGEKRVVSSGGYIVFIEAQGVGQTLHVMRRKIAVVR